MKPINCLFKLIAASRDFACDSVDFLLLHVRQKNVFVRNVEVMELRPIKN